MKSILSAVIGATLALSAIEAGAQATPGERQVSLTIESTSLATALDKWAQQSGFQIFVQDWEATKNLRAPSLKGTFAAQDALEQLLAGTSLTYVWIDSNTVSIRKRGSQTVPTSLQRTSLDGQLGIPVAKFSGDDAGSGAANPASLASQDSLARSGNALRPERMEEVIVTGTNIRDSAPIGARVIVMDREEMENTGFSTIQEVLSTLTENWQGGTGTDVSAQNVTGAAVVNLRGLGADSTLVLVDGRRQAVGGINGAFVDISSIALSAIDRIEVLPDGASAIYGSDAVGGVVNIILRKDYSGAETSAHLRTLGNGATETQVSQLLGKTWAAGNVLLGYQYLHRDSLKKIDRKYTATNDFTRFGGSDFRTAWSNPGNILCPFGEVSCSFGEPAFAIPAGQSGSGLTSADLIPGAVNHQSVSPREDLTPEQEANSAFVTGAVTVGERMQLFGEGRYTRRTNASTGDGAIGNVNVPDFNPFYVNPFGSSQTTVDVAYNFIDDLGPIEARSTTDTYAVTLGASAGISDAWQATLAASYGREKVDYRNRNRVDDFAVFVAAWDPDPATAFNPFGDGSHTNPSTIEAIRFNEFARMTSDIRTINLIADGPLVSLPAGAIKLAAGGEYREEGVTPDSERIAGVLSAADVQRNVSAAFGELSVPLLGASDGGGHRLDMSLAGRYEDYSDFGSKFTKKVGLSWLPLRGLMLRGTWGTSFKAPRLIELLDTPEANPNNFAAIVAASDPLSPSGFSNVLFRFGGNAALRPETAESWTAGVELRPEAISDFSLVLGYFDIRYQNRIAAGGPANFFTTLLEESEWSEIIDRTPDPAEVEAICNAPNAFCSGLTPTVLVDARLRNLASVAVDGLDLHVGKGFRTGHGEITLGLDGTYMLHFNQKVSRSSAEIDRVDTVLNTPALRLRGSVGWRGQRIGVNAFVNYLGDMTDTINTPNVEIPSWTTVDTQITYEPGQSDGMLAGVEVSLSAINVFDKDPPFVNLQGAGYDVANASLLGRVLGLRVVKQW